MSRRWLAAVLTLAVTGALALVTSSVASPAGAATSPAWTPPLTLGAGAEPSIRELPAGSKDLHAAIVSAPAGTGSNFWDVDDVKRADGTHIMKGSAPQQPDLGTGGGDSEISVGQLSKAGTCP